MSKETLKEEILAKIEIDKIHANNTAKEIASKHLGKHAINYITILVIIGVVSSQFLIQVFLLFLRPQQYVVIYLS